MSGNLGVLSHLWFKSNSPIAPVRCWNHAYNLRPNFTPLNLSISLVLYTKIFRTLSHHQAQVQDHVLQKPNQPNALNMARYRKAVYSALWVQLAFVVCYVPFTIVETVNALSKIYSSHLVINWGIALSLVYCNSTLNPFIYYWRIREVRRAVKQKIRQALHF